MTKVKDLLFFKKSFRLAKRIDDFSLKAYYARDIKKLERGIKYSNMLNKAIENYNERH